MSKVVWTKKKILELFEGNYLKPLENIKEGQDSKVLCETLEGYIVVAKVVDIKLGKEPRCFHKNNPHTINNIKKWLCKNNKDFVLMDSEYKGNAYKMKFYCLIHNEYFYKSWKSIIIGEGCQLCGFENRILKRSMTQNEFIKRSANIHDDFYEYSRTIYKNYHNKVTITCPTHGDFEQSPASHLKGCGCMECGHIKSSIGKYNITNANKYINEWIEICSLIYIIKCEIKNENFYKVGITTKNSVKERFPSNIDLPYNFKEICLINTNLYHSVFIESELKNNILLRYKYSPEIRFNGHTECFSQIDANKINEVLKQYSDVITSIENYSDKYNFKID